MNSSWKIKIKKTFGLTTLIALGVNTGAEAGPLISLRNHRIMGDGCPPGSVSIVLTEDQSALSVIFDQFQIQKGSNGPLQFKRCNIAIPVDQTPDSAVVIEQLDVRGYNNLPHQARSHLVVRYGVGPRWIQVLNRTYAGPLDLDFFESVSLDRVNGKLHTRCGESFELGLSLIIGLVSQLPGEDALMTVDTIDGRNGKVTYRLSRDQCRPGGRPGGRLVPGPRR